MANSSVPYGFRAVGLLDGSVPNFGVYRSQIISSNTNKIFYGDVLKPITAGYFDVFTAETPGGAPVGGVAGGYFAWQSNSQRKTARQNWWPGTPSDVVTSGLVGLSVEANPQTVFQCRTAGTSAAPVTQASVGLNANFVVAAGNTLNGLSAFALDDATLGTGPSLPFKVIGIVLAPESDPTSIYNEVLVIMNNLTQA